MAAEPFRWRDSPAVIARYVHDRDVTKGAEVTLKPNEACVVVEDGKVAGVATQQHMEVNPQAGILSKMFGRGNPKRTFLFVFLGPHDLLVRLTGHTNDGQPANGMVRLRVHISREQAPRLLQMPAKGKMALTAGTLVNAIEPEIQGRLTPMILAQTQESLRSVEVTEDIEADLKVSMRGTFDSLGLSLEGSFVNWNVTEAERMLQMRVDLENLVERNAILNETESAEMERLLESNLRRAELEARSRMVDIAAEERAKVEIELARVRAAGEVEGARWRELNSLKMEQNEAKRVDQHREATHQVEMAKAESLQQTTLDEVEHQRLVQSDEREMEKKRAKAELAKEMFADVQARKKERMQMEADKESDRLDRTQQSTEKMIEALTNIAASNPDSEVAMEALKQISELRRIDADAASDAYLRD